ncbi:MAG: glycosyltransferase, partial [Candidatus Marinimicrobia bacterium]|nr:glycosyltransferase [Candidatus Neomarinimicrobiota bacterium]
MLNPKTEISVVVPLYNEGPNLLTFFEELDGAMTTFGKSYEIIFVNDGSTDNSEKVLTDIAKQNKHTQVINLRKNAGKPGALEQGFELASGNKIVIMDSDLQYDPKDIQFLIAKIDEGYDVVSGRRV